jgi:hypothetical protein
MVNYNMFFFIEELQGGAGEIYRIIPSFHPYLSTNMCAKLRNVFHTTNTLC